MQLVQEYFDEVTYDTCGICDVCLQKKKKASLDVFDDYEEQILYLLGQKPLTIEELETQVAPKDREVFVEAVREMVDAGQIFYDDLWVLHLQTKSS